jgi:NAD(P)-dependent dehydrogenase (short-subunit alcohol dehydrogenase family)
VYRCTRAFLPMLLKSEEGHIVNTSSVNGAVSNAFKSRRCPKSEGRSAAALI